MDILREKSLAGFCIWTHNRPTSFFFEKILIITSINPCTPIYSHYSGIPGASVVFIVEAPELHLSDHSLLPRLKTCQSWTRSKFPEICFPILSIAWISQPDCFQCNFKTDQKSPRGENLFIWESLEMLKKKKERLKKASTGEINIILRGFETNFLRVAQSLARYWWLVDTLY